MARSDEFLFFAIGHLGGRIDTHYIGSARGANPVDARRNLETTLEEAHDEELIDLWERSEERWCMRASERLDLDDFRRKTI